MKILKVHAHPEYWGQVTDRQADELAIKMRNCAESAGFQYVTTLNGGTTSACEMFQYGEPSNGTDLGDELDWFSRWCAHGFRGMVAWLKSQIA